MKCFDGVLSGCGVSSVFVEGGVRNGVKIASEDVMTGSREERVERSVELCAIGVCVGCIDVDYVKLRVCEFNCYGENAARAVSRGVNMSVIEVLVNQNSDAAG